MSSVHDRVSLLLVAVSLGALWLEPSTVYRCAPDGEGLARCEISGRALGLAPLRRAELRGIAAAVHDSRVESHETVDSKGRQKTKHQRVETLTFRDAAGRELWSASKSMLLGATMTDLQQEVEALAQGESRRPFLRCQAVWPVLLIASLFLLIGGSHLGTRLGQALMARGVLPPAAGPLAYWGPTVAIVVLLAFAWASAAFGARPPALLAPLLGG
jgi:hypothetical protein